MLKQPGDGLPKRGLWGFPWVEFKPSEEEEYGDLEAFELSNASCYGLDLLNRCFDGFCVGADDRWFQVCPKQIRFPSPYKSPIANFKGI